MKKVAVVNRTNLKNYGSVLQVYALVESVKGLGYDCCVVFEDGNLSKHFDFRPKKIFKTGVKLITNPKLIFGMLKTIKEVRHKEVSAGVAELFDAFVKTNFEQKLYSSKELECVAESDEYSKFICGSDQVWCSTTTYVDPLMYLRFAPRNKRIAYAPSIGRNYIPSYNRREMKKYINGIDCVSVREEDGKRLIKELTGRDVPVVLDPTLLFMKEQWQKLKNDGCKPNERYILCYFLDSTSDDVKAKVVECAKENDVKIVSIGIPLTDLPDRLVCSILPCGPAEFLSLVEGAEMVITDSYHGMLFAMNFERRFWSVERNYQQFDQSSRQLTILNMLGLSERYLKSDLNFDMSEIDYVSVKAKICELRTISLDYLKTSIES